MPTLLAIEVSPRHEFSTSRKLTALFIARWKAARPGAAVVVRDLMRTPPPFVDLAWIGGAFTPREQHSPESAAAIKVSDGLVAELKAADHIVIGTPMFNFSIPAVLKAYIDQIVRVGVTVSPNNVGLLTGKKATIILASGDFSPGSAVEKYNQVSGYLRQVRPGRIKTSRSSWPAERAPAPRVKPQSSSSAPMSFGAAATPAVAA
jgi:FMN-dependent NADH-azoreductase